MKYLIATIILLVIPAYIFYPRPTIMEDYPKFDGELIPIEIVDEIVELEVVIASWYDYTLDECNGCVWSEAHATAASRTLPRYSMARVMRVDTGKYVDVYINDYGPEESTGRDIDLSSYTFSLLSPLEQGLIEVTIKPL